jgi:hypothetical protein
MKKLIFCVLITISFSCNNNLKNQEEKSSSECISKISDIQNKKLLGVWRLKNETNATFKIVKDSINYIDENQSVHYIVKEDSMYIYYDGFVDSNSFKVVDNELILNSKLSKDTFIRQD